MEKMQEPINKDVGELKNKHTETNNTITEIKNTLEGINSTISERISELEDKMVKITSDEQNKLKRMKRTKDSLRDLWENIKHTNIQKTKIMASNPITVWQIDEEKVEAVTDFIFLVSKITADSDRSHEIKNTLAP